MGRPAWKPSLVSPEVAAVKAQVEREKRVSFAENPEENLRREAEAAPGAPGVEKGSKGGSKGSGQQQSGPQYWPDKRDQKGKGQGKGQQKGQQKGKAKFGKNPGGKGKGKKGKFAKGNAFQRTKVKKRWSGPATYTDGKLDPWWISKRKEKQHHREVAATLAAAEGGGEHAPGSLIEGILDPGDEERRRLQERSASPRHRERDLDTGRESPPIDE